MRDLLQSEIENSYLKVMTKCNRSLLQCASGSIKYVWYYKVHHVFQSMKDRYYKVRQLLQSVTVITK